MSQKRKKKTDSRPLKIAVVTGGGDCPGLNAVIRAVVVSALNRGWEIYGIERGFEGLLHKDRIMRLESHHVRGIIHTGGTILGTTNRGNPFKLTTDKKGGKKGKTKVSDLSAEVVKRFKKLGFDAMIVIGGDGTLKIAAGLAELGMPVVGVPKTIDNDLAATELTFGFSTAITTATDAIDKLHATAASHERVMVVEVMGRYAGWIALYAGVAGGADVILLPEIPFEFDGIVRKINQRWQRKRNFAIVVVAEGARPVDGEVMYQESVDGEPARLGGMAEFVARELHRLTKRETRSLVLGHLQRGGQPTAADRLLSTRFGAAAVRAVERGEHNCMVALQSSSIVTVPLSVALSSMKSVPLESDVIQSARDIGISFGDEV